MELLFEDPNYAHPGNDLAGRIDVLLYDAAQSGKTVRGIRLATDELRLLRQAGKVNVRAGFYTYRDINIWAP